MAERHASYDGLGHVELSHNIPCFRTTDQGSSVSNNMCQTKVHTIKGLKIHHTERKESILQKNCLIHVEYKRIVVDPD